MDAGIQAMDGNLTVLQVLHFGNVVALSLPSWTLDWLTTALWFGLSLALRASKSAPGGFVGILAEMTGLGLFVYNDERRSEGNHLNNVITAFTSLQPRLRYFIRQSKVFKPKITVFTRSIADA